MPRIGSDLHNVVSTMLSAEHFGFLKRLAKDYYNRDIISQPTISHVLRYLVTKEKELANNEHNLGKSNKLPQAAYKERMSKGHAYHTDSSTSLNATPNPG